MVCVCVLRRIVESATNKRFTRMRFVLGLSLGSQQEPQLQGRAEVRDGFQEIFPQRPLTLT